MLLKGGVTIFDRNIKLDINTVRSKCSGGGYYFLDFTAEIGGI